MTKHGVRVLAALAAIGLYASQSPRLRAQNPPADTGSATPAFDVASVRLNTSGDTRTNLETQPGGRFTATNIVLRELIRITYGVPELRLLGGPGWISSQRYDITAKAVGELTPGRAPDQLRHLLADRFKLKVHNETREQPTYDLVLARPDGKLGPALHPVPIDRCVELTAQVRRGEKPAPPQSGERIPCGMNSAQGTLRAGSISISPLAGALTSRVGRLVVDRTGLTGFFDYELTWSPEQTADATGPSIFTALQEQLGLKLEASRGTVEVVVIDNVEPPTAD